MKKLTLVFGYLAVILIALFAWFKINHWPGAHVLLLAGSFVFILGYAPLLYLVRKDLVENGLQKLINLLGMLTMMFFGAAVLFRVLHWPYPVFFSCSAYTLLVITLLLMIYQAIGKKGFGFSLVNHNISILAFLVLIIMVFMELTTVPKSILQDFSPVITSQNKEIQYFTGKTAALFENFDKTPDNAVTQAYLQKAEEVKSTSDSLVNYIKSVGEELMFMAHKKQISFDSLEDLSCKANRKVGYQLMVTQKNDSIFKAKYTQYKAFMTENTNSRGKEILDLFFTIDDSIITDKYGKSTDWSTRRFKLTLASILTQLNADIVHVRLVESETINYLQAMQAKAALKGQEVKDKLNEKIVK